MDYPEIRDPIVLRFSMRVTATFVRIRGGSVPPADPPEPGPGEFHFLLPAGIEPFVTADGQVRVRRTVTAGGPSRARGEEPASRDGRKKSNQAALAKEVLRLSVTETALNSDWLRGAGTALEHGATELFGIRQAEAQEGGGEAEDPLRDREGLS